MNKQEAIEKIENLEGLTILDKTINLDSEMIPKKEVFNIVKQIDEQEKPKVPQFVADWIEVCRENLGFGLSLAISLYTSAIEKQPKNLKYWLESKGNQDTFARAWLDGYEIEKEKLYTVRFASEDFDTIYIVIFKKFNKLGISLLPLNDDKLKSWFTEYELKKLKFWKNPAFEIEEVKK